MLIRNIAVLVRRLSLPLLLGPRLGLAATTVVALRSQQHCDARSVAFQQVLGDFENVRNELADEVPREGFADYDAEDFGVFA